MIKKKKVFFLLIDVFTAFLPRGFNMKKWIKIEKIPLERSHYQKAIYCKKPQIKIVLHDYQPLKTKMSQIRGLFFLTKGNSQEMVELNLQQQWIFFVNNKARTTWYINTRLVNFSPSSNSD